MVKSDINDVNSIKRLVDSFYKSAAADDLLGPIFNDVTSSARQREALYKYWQTTLIDDVNGQTFPKHIESMFSPQHFIRWLTLFLQNIDNLYAGPNAEKAKVIVIRKSEEFQSSLEIIRF